MTITPDDCQLRETLGNLLKASDELASAIELSAESFDTGLLDDIAPSKRELVLAANSARKILNAGASTKPDITKKAIAANIEAMRKMLMDTVLRTSEAFQAIQAGEQNQAIGAMLDLDRDLEDALALHRAAVALHRTGRAS
ncbi:MAG TPA: hypothetical protein VE957_04625 [Terriglobales bacterium]|nr:hypothetical protein [Terriglobales bacterium]